MAGGLIALLDDVAAIAKVAAASVDDVIAQSMKASTKAAGAVIDDAAVTPSYVHGFSAARELPIVWKIARGSIFNKLVILLPVAMLLSAFAPWAIPPLLMLGGAYLCFEGAEKVWHALSPKSDHGKERIQKMKADAHLEEKRVRGAVKTDFILSAEIMTIVLSALPDNLSQPMIGGALAFSAMLITTVVYGAVALIVKADDVALRMVEHGRMALTRRLGRAVIKGMPGFMALLVLVGTAAMIWVGGSILVHGLHELGVHAPGDIIHDWAVAVAQTVPAAVQGAVEWIVTAFLDGIVGLAVGSVLVILIGLIRPAPDHAAASHE